MTTAPLRLALTPDQIAQQLSQLSGWRWVESAPCLMKSWTFESFGHVMTCLAQIAELAEQLDHHPHITTCYTFLQIQLSTHDIQGISTLDIQLATMIDSLIHRHFNTS
jgi:4a-hydroxytetrahydrobiopterin dehydratase